MLALLIVMADKLGASSSFSSSTKGDAIFQGAKQH